MLRATYLALRGSIRSGVITIGDTFKTFLSNIAVDNADTISLRYGEITRALNQCFRDTESKAANSLQVGSYGRHTAIKGISDLDMLYIMPIGEWDNYDKQGGQYELLSDTAKAIRDRYPTTKVRVAGLVVQIIYQKFQIEVQPVFRREGGGFSFPDTIDGGRWRETRPQEEIDAMYETNQKKNKNLRRLCKMVRAWKNKHGVAMGGLLIDTLAHRFMVDTEEYDTKSYLYYDHLSRDFFKYLSDLPEQEYFAALGSGQRVKVKKKFQKRAKKAYELCVKAIEAEGKTNQNAKWRAVFGRAFPPDAEKLEKAYLVEANYTARNTEEFIEDTYPVDIRYSIKLDCEVTQPGFRTFLLRSRILQKLPLYTKKSLRFVVTECDVPRPFTLFWKVLNRGPEAIRKDCIRGQIVGDGGGMDKIEKTNFRGDHVVECYAVKDDVVVATARIHVPIQDGVES